MTIEEGVRGPTSCWPCVPSCREIEWYVAETVNTLEVAVAYVAERVFTSIQYVISKGDRLVSSRDGIGMLLRIGAQAVMGYDIARHGQKMSRTALAEVDTCLSVLDGIAVIESANYLVNGGLYRDIREHNIWGLVARIASACERVGLAMHWMRRQGFFVQIEQQIAMLPLYETIAPLGAFPIIDTFSLVSSGSLLGERMACIMRGEDVVSNGFDAASLGLVCLVSSWDMAVRMLSAPPPPEHLPITLGLVSLACGVIAFSMTHE